MDSAQDEKAWKNSAVHKKQKSNLSRWKNLDQLSIDNVGVGLKFLLIERRKFIINKAIYATS